MQKIQGFLSCYPLVTAQHTVHQITQRPPVIFPTRELVLIDKQDIVFEASVEVRLKTEVHDYRVVVAVNMSVNTVQALEDLADETGEGLGKWNTCR